MTCEFKRVLVYYCRENDSWWARASAMPGWSGWNGDLQALREETRQAIFLETGCFPVLASGITGQSHAHDTFNLLSREDWAD